MIKELGMPQNQTRIKYDLANFPTDAVFDPLRRLHGCHKLIGGMCLGHKVVINNNTFVITLGHLDAEQKE